MRSARLTAQLSCAESIIGYKQRHHVQRPHRLVFGFPGIGWLSSHRVAHGDRKLDPAAAKRIRNSTRGPPCAHERQPQYGGKNPPPTCPPPAWGGGGEFEGGACWPPTRRCA